MKRALLRPATLAWLALLALALLLPVWLGPFYIRVVQFFFFSAALAVAWNMLGGFAGYWSFGHTAFIGMGAFSAAHLVMATGGMGAGPLALVVAVPVAGLVCAGFAAVIAFPVLRLRGIYFAIAMLGVGNVVGELVNNVPGLQGGVGVFLPSPVPPGVRPEIFYYYLFGAMLLVCLAIAAWLSRSRAGYALFAIREDEDTAMMLGVATERYKIAVFILSAALVGMLGALYGFSMGYFTTQTVFRLDFSLNMIVFCLIGGIGTPAGPLIGAALMLFITQVLLSGYLDVHVLVTGAIVVVIVLLMPAGILGTWSAWRTRRHTRRRTRNDTSGEAR